MIPKYNFWIVLLSDFNKINLSPLMFFADKDQAIQCLKPPKAITRINMVLPWYMLSSEYQAKLN